MVNLIESVSGWEEKWKTIRHDVPSTRTYDRSRNDDNNIKNIYDDFNDENKDNQNDKSHINELSNVKKH